MIKTISAERIIDAPAEVIYERLADIGRHPEWDRTAARAEPIGQGDPTAIGAEWKVYERFSLVDAVAGTTQDQETKSTALSKRTLKALAPNRRVEWSTHMIPNLGISATVTWTLTPQGGSTRAAVEVAISVPTVMEKVTGLVFRHMDEKLEQQLTASADGLKEAAEAAAASLLVTA